MYRLGWTLHICIYTVRSRLDTVAMVSKWGHFVLAKGMAFHKDNLEETRQTAEVHCKTMWTQLKAGKEVTVSGHWDTAEAYSMGLGLYGRLSSPGLHDTDTAIELALCVVVVDVGVVSGGGRCGQASAVRGAAMLDEDINAFLTSCSPGIGQGGLAPGVPTLHIHAILNRGQEEKNSVNVSPTENTNRIVHMRQQLLTIFTNSVITVTFYTNIRRSPVITALYTLM